MKILSLNCQGLGRPKAVHDLRSLFELHQPMLVLLSETRFFTHRMDGLLRSLGYARGLGVASYGRGGSIALLWKENVGVKLQTLDKLHIDVVM